MTICALDVIPLWRLNWLVRLYLQSQSFPLSVFAQATCLSVFGRGHCVETELFAAYWISMDQILALQSGIGFINCAQGIIAGIVFPVACWGFWLWQQGIRNMADGQEGSGKAWMQPRWCVDAHTKPSTRVSLERKWERGVSVVAKWHILKHCMVMCATVICALCTLQNWDWSLSTFTAVTLF
jgi:hypothetical protein